MTKGIGLGFRRDIADETIDMKGTVPGFIEVAPENWMSMGGYWRKKLKKAAERYPITTHGLSLSIGSPEPVDYQFLKKVKAFVKEYNIEIYSEHLSYSSCDNAHLYDLLPIPFRDDAVKHIVQKIKEVQDYLEMPLALENVSYYTPVAAEMDEASFIRAIVEESGCNLLLDINNVYVNAHNHQYDAHQFIQALPLNKVQYMHIAGHDKVSEDLIIDTHGEAIIDPVYDLLEWSMDYIRPVPILLERDFNIPDISALQGELNRLQTITKEWEVNHVA